MKRAFLAIGLIFIGAAAMAAEEDSSSLTIRPSQMKDGETKTFIDDGKKITVRRDGDALKIEVDGADETKRLTIVKTGEGDITIDRDGERRGFRIQTPGGRLMIDGLPQPGRRQLANENWFVCPKDGTMVRVPEGKEKETYRCPVDGTTLEKKKGRGFTIWMGEGLLEGHPL